MIMSGFTTIEMSSSLLDCQFSEGGLDGRRGQDHDEWKRIAAGACNSTSAGPEADAGEGCDGVGAVAASGPAVGDTGAPGRRRRVGALRAWSALEPANPRGAQDEDPPAL